MVKIENLSFTYPGSPRLFDRLDLTLPMGNIYGLLGKNGAGKSTLLKMMSGLLFPTQGELYVAGFRPQDRLPRFLQEIYVITEEFFLPAFSIKRFVALYSPFYPRFNHHLMDEYLREFELLKEQKLSTLSYGQKKKFLLSFGLATDCKLLILDEPTNGLDILAKSQFRKIVASAIHEDRSFIISTHQARDMESLIDPIIILDEGNIVFFQSYEQISRRLTLTKEAELPDHDRLVYSESLLGGYTVIQENTARAETNMNLEMLFKAVISNRSKINEIFETT